MRSTEERRTALSEADKKNRFSDIPQVERDKHIGNIFTSLGLIEKSDGVRVPARTALEVLSVDGDRVTVNGGDRFGIFEVNAEQLGQGAKGVDYMAEQLGQVLEEESAKKS